VDVPPGTLNAILKQAGPRKAGSGTRRVDLARCVPDLPRCVAVGESRPEVLRLIREAIELHITALREEGLPIPEPSSAG